MFGLFFVRDIEEDFDVPEVPPSSDIIHNVTFPPVVSSDELPEFVYFSISKQTDDNNIDLLLDAIYKKESDTKYSLVTPLHYSLVYPGFTELKFQRCLNELSFSSDYIFKLNNENPKNSVLVSGWYYEDWSEMWLDDPNIYLDEVNNNNYDPNETRCDMLYITNNGNFVRLNNSPLSGNCDLEVGLYHLLGPWVPGNGGSTYDWGFEPYDINPNYDRALDYGIVLYDENPTYNGYNVSILHLSSAISEEVQVKGLSRYFSEECSQLLKEHGFSDTNLLTFKLINDVNSSVSKFESDYSNTGSFTYIIKDWPQDLDDIQNHSPIISFCLNQKAWIVDITDCGGAIKEEYRNQNEGVVAISYSLFGNYNNVSISGNTGRLVFDPERSDCSFNLIENSKTSIIVSYQ